MALTRRSLPGAQGYAPADAETDDHRDEPGEQARHAVRQREEGAAVPYEEVALDDERRERGVGPEETGGDERSQVAAGREPLDEQRERATEHGAAGDVRPERRPREPARRRDDEL